MRIDAAGGPSIGGIPFSAKPISVRQFRGISSASVKRLYMPPAGTVETSAPNFGAPACAIGPEFLWKRVRRNRTNSVHNDYAVRLVRERERYGTVHAEHPQLEQHSGQLGSRR